MRVVHVCTFDSQGAGSSAYRLHHGLRRLGVDSTFLTLCRLTNDPSVRVLPVIREGDQPAFTRASSKAGELLYASNCGRWERILAEYPNHQRPLEMFSDPVSSLPLDAVPEIRAADIINLHWTAGTVDICSLGTVLDGRPVVWTLHDMNPFTGGCHYAGACVGYTGRCGSCPVLGSKDAHDVSAAILSQKVKALQGLNVTVVTPSVWLGECTRQSAVLRTFAVNVIPYGLPIDEFSPMARTRARASFGLPADKKLILFGASSIGVRRKGFIELVSALKLLAGHPGCEGVGLAIFGRTPEGYQPAKSAPVFNLGVLEGNAAVSRAFSAADLFVMPTLEDNLPNTVLEAMACATPVVAFATGGVPDMVEHMITGYLAGTGNVASLAEGMAELVTNDGLREQMGAAGRKAVEERYDEQIQARAYAALYEALLRGAAPRPAATRAPVGGEPPARYVDEGYPGLSRLVARITKLLEQGRSLQAIRLFDREGPHFPEGLADLAQLESMLGRLRRARVAQGQATSHASSHEGARARAIALCRQMHDDPGSFGHRFRAVRAYLDDYPDDSDVRAMLVRAHGVHLDHCLDRAETAPHRQAGRSCSISAIVSTYASSRFLPTCLADLSAQTAADELEVIVVDACSPEDEREIVAGWRQGRPHIRFIRTGSRVSIYHAWNLAIRAARGEFITPLSTNDRIHPGAYALLREALRAAPAAGLAYGDTLLTDLPNQSMDSYRPSTQYDGAWRWPAFSYEDLLSSCRVGPHPMWRSAVHERFGYFDETYKADADQDFWLRLGRERFLLHVPEVTGLAWLTNQSLSGEPGALAELREIRQRHQNAHFARCHRRHLPPGTPASLARVTLERDRDAVVDADPRSCERPITLELFADRIVDFVRRGNAAKAVRYYDLYRCLMPPADDLAALDAQVERLRSMQGR